MDYSNRAIRAVAVGVLLAVLPAAAAQARPAEPLTKIEARAMPPAKLERRVLDQLGDILMPSPQPRTARPRRELEDLSFWTRPIAADTPGLCKSARVIVKFSPVEAIDRGAETPVKATGLSADLRFRFLADQPRFLDEATRANTLTADDAGCARLNPDEQDFTRADDEETFVNGFWLIRGAVERINRGADLPVTCDSDRVPPQACGTLLAKFPINAVGGMKRCDAARGDPITTSCVSVGTGELDAKIYWRYGSDEIRRVEMLEYIVLTHERAD